jgi:hypothetical protein
MRYELHGIRDATMMNVSKALRRGGQLHVDLLIRVVRRRLTHSWGKHAQVDLEVARRLLAAPPGWQNLGESACGRSDGPALSR